MLDIKSITIGVLFGIALVFIWEHLIKKEKRELPPWVCSSYMQFPTMTARQ